MNTHRWMRRGVRVGRFVYANTVTRLFLWVFVLTVAGGTAVSVFETGVAQANIHGFWEGIWWAIVTITTTGFGDRYPVTNGGRFLAILVMFGGIGLISILTATISSYFVESRLRKGQGLDKIKLKGHIVICGWNFNVDMIIQTLEAEIDYPSVVLVNNANTTQMDEFTRSFTDAEVRFVSGDYSQDSVLEKASIGDAVCVILVADSSELTANKADEKTIITALTIKNMNPKIRLYAHVVDPDNVIHLQRAKADDVVISDKYSGFLLAKHVTNPGVPRVVDELLTYTFGNEIVRLSIPEDLVGRTFIELSEYFKVHENAILIGLVKESRLPVLTEILSDGDSYLDLFIRKKLQESGKKLGEEERIKTTINPPQEMIIDAGHSAVVIANKTSN